VRLLCWLGLSPRKFQRWKDRYGKANEHNAMIPRDHWIEPEERVAIIQFARQYPLEGYRRLSFMMLDRDIVAVSPTTTYRVLKAAGKWVHASGRPHVKARASSNHSRLMNTGTWIFPM
jgi:putative transposase